MTLANFGTKGGPGKTRERVPGRRSGERSDTDPSSRAQCTRLPHRRCFEGGTNVKNMVLIQCRCREATHIYIFAVFITSKSISATYRVQCLKGESPPSNTPISKNPLTPGVVPGNQNPSPCHRQKTDREGTGSEEKMVFQCWRLCCSSPCSRFKNSILKTTARKVQLAELGKSARARPGSHTTDFRGQYSGYFSPGGHHTSYRIRVSTNNLILRPCW